MNGLNPILQRYLLVFFLFSLLILILFVPVYVFISDFVMNTELSYMNGKLHNGIEVFDSALEALNSTVMFISHDSRFLVFQGESSNPERDPYPLSELRNLFASLVIPHVLIADAGIIFNQNTILTKNRMFYFTEYYHFYGPFLRGDYLSIDEWLNYLSENRPIVPLLHYESADYGSYDAITFAARWSASTAAPGENLIFAVMPVQEILSLIMDENIIDRVNIRIYDDRETLIYESKNEKYKKMHFISNQSSVCLLRFEITIPELLMQEKLRPTRNLIFLFALVSAFFSIFLSLLFAYRISAPVRKLFARVAMTRNVKSEYEKYKTEKRVSSGSLRSIYSGLAESISTVDMKLENSLVTINLQTQIIRTQIFDMALNYGLYDSDKLSEFLSVFHDFPKQYQLGILCYSFSSILTVQETAVSQIELMNLVKNKLNSVYLQSINGNDIVLLLPLYSDDVDWHARINTLRKELIRQIDLPLNIFLSSVFDKPQDLPQAWQQIRLINSLSGTGDVSSAEEIPNVTLLGVQLPINISKLKMISDALCNANATAAEAILRESTEVLLKTEDSLLCSHIYSLLSNLITQLKLENPSILFDIFIPEYETGAQYEFFHHLFPECFREIAKRIKQNREENISKFGRQVLDFINEHLYDPNLYITMVTNHFNISNPTLQKIIKSVSDQTFFSYVEKHRLNKAFGMLAAKKCSLHEIAQSCGFLNANSFYKAFKRNYGYPPSEIKFHR